MRTAVLSLAMLVAAAGTAVGSELGSDRWVRSVEQCTDKDPRWCAALHKQMTEEWPQALKGDYQAQRNVSYCLVDGCDGLVERSKLLGCAWRAVILVSGSPKITDSDLTFFDRLCLRGLTPVELEVSKAQAARIFAEVYKGRKAPSFPW